MFHVYVLECADRTLYVGHTDNLDERLRQHEIGAADAYTSRRRPLTLRHVEEFESRYEALAMERRLKGWGRAKKLAYMAGDWNAIHKLAKGKHLHER
jgi:predicted GIY-YIG superfamily endonuclease